MSGSLERQIREMFESAHLFAFGDEAPPPTGTVVDPTQAAVALAALQQEMREAIILVAREVDEVKARLA
jgi:hypothetical protein